MTRWDRTPQDMGGASKKPPFLHSLNILRLFLALHILSSHIFPHFFESIGIPNWGVVLFASSAGLSTQIFFVLSGFILMYNYQNKGHPWWKHFIYRMRKIWPTFVIPTTIACLYFLAFNPNNYESDLLQFQWYEWLKSILLLEPWFFDKPVYNIAAWASSVFALGYLTVSCLGDQLLRFGQKAWIPMALAITASMVITLTFLLLNSNSLSGPYLPFKQYSSLESNFRHYPAYRYLEVLTGIFAGVWYRSSPERWRMKSSTVGLSLSIVLVAVTVVFCMWTPTSTFFVTHGLLLPAIVMLLCIYSADSKSLKKLGKARFMRVGSEYSLAIFFIHWPLHRILENIFSEYGQENVETSLIYFCVYLICLFILIIPLKKSVDAIGKKIEAWIKW